MRFSAFTNVVPQCAELVLQNIGIGDKAQTTAEQDMEIIRTKRATSAAGGPAATGQPKSKYRKRSVSILNAMVLESKRLILFVSGCGPASGRPPLGNVIPATFARRLSGDVGLMVQERYAMRVVCVSSAHLYDGCSIY
jgi:hypothetical protein